MNTQSAIKNLQDEWTQYEDMPSISLEVELTTRTLLMIQSVPVLFDAFKLVSQRAGLSSENRNWNELRDSAIGVLTSFLKRHEEHAQKQTRSANYLQRSIYGR